ncbi:methyl-accepting chemotaxis protein [Pseudomonas sp. CAU 1711]|uniref:methyl-accepting chemotaxis protein n=1 Tax=Pseudomonas sp. CAU 1711 TaxID=3140356 RepID=UPI003260CA57
MDISSSSKTTPLALCALAATFIALLYSFLAMKQASSELREVSENRYNSYLLADELRQSSDDLTRLGRTYVVSADPRYEQQYLRVLDIRNGKVPRPEKYHRIYWDFVAAGIDKPRPDGQTIALAELMKQAGFTDNEFAKLRQAQANSDGLVQLEVKAMNAVKGLFEDGQGGYTRRAEPDLELARNLLHSPEYHRYKADIMKPVDEFFALLEERTGVAVQRADRALANAQYLFVAVLLVLVGEVLLLIYLGRRQTLSRLGAKPAVLDHVLGEIAVGNLAVAIPEASEDSALGRVRLMNERLKTLIGEALSTSEQLHAAVGQVGEMVDNTAARAAQQNQMTELVSTAVHEMGLTVQEIARNASSAAQSSRTASDEAQQARQVVGESSRHIQNMADEIGNAAQAVSHLAGQVSSIDQVLAVIRGISEQTNLLALNAAIEAARAGEMGRGFAVVADEVRTLASRTQASTDEIQQMIQGLKQGADSAVHSMHASQAATGTGVEASRHTGESLQVISQQIDHISDMNRQVATATEQQSSVTEEINRNVQSIADIAHTTTAEAKHCQEDCRTLRRLADDLASRMGSFHL